MGWYEELTKRKSPVALAATTQASHAGQDVGRTIQEPLAIERDDEGLLRIGTDAVNDAAARDEESRQAFWVSPTSGPSRKVSLAASDDYVPEKSREELQRQFDVAIRPEDYGIESEADEAGRKRYEKLQLGYAGFVDGLNALSNLYFTTKGAPSQQLKPITGNVTGEQMKNRLQRLQNLKEFRAALRQQQNAERQYAAAVEKGKRDYELALARMKQDQARFEAEQEAKEKARADEYTFKWAGLNETQRHNRVVEVNKRVENGIKQANASGRKGRVVQEGVFTSDGFYVREAALKENEKRAIVVRYLNTDKLREPFMVFKGVGGKEMDWDSAFAYLQANSMITPSDLPGFVSDNAFKGKPDDDYDLTSDDDGNESVI